MNKNLLETSRKYKAQADKLLVQSGLVESLKQHGEVHFTGAYAGDVMMHGDVDITVVRDEPYTIQEVFDIFKAIYFQGKFKSYFIGGDWDDPRKGKEFPHGYYIGFKDKVDGEKWKFDVWFISREDFEERNKLFSIDKVQLTDEQKERILFFKQYRKDNKLGMTGQVIYTAVLEGNCKTIEEFNNFVESQKSSSLHASS